MRKISSREMQEATLEVMKKIHDICVENDLKYFLAYGTLIGAIRHNGYIPWDDDLDIMMPREDYEKLISIFMANNNHIDTLEIFTPENNVNYPYMISRVSDSKYLIETENEANSGMGVFIDIYPLDGLGKDFNKAKKIMKKTNYLSSFYFRSTRLKPILRNSFSIPRKIVEVIIFTVSKVLTKDFFYKRLSKYKGMYEYNTSDYIGCIIWHSRIDEDIYSKDLFNKVLIHKFEKYEFYIPEKYDHILKMSYGDYMKLPPKEDRIGHHFYKTYIKE